MTGRARAALAAMFALGMAGCSDCGGVPRRRDAGARLAKTADAGPAKAKVARSAVLPEAQILEIEGDVRWDRSGRVANRLAGADTGPAGDAPPAVGDDLRIGDAIEVGQSGRAVLRLPDQGRVAMGTESRVVVSPYAMNELGLLRGRLHASLDAPGQGRRSLKIATAGAYLLVQGREILVGAGDDGSVRIVALSGVVSVRGPAGRSDLPQGRALEVDASGRSGAHVSAPPDAEALASMDGWVQGRREIVRRGAGAARAVLARLVAAEIDAAPAEFEKVAKAREHNRDLLRGLRDRRGGKASGPPPEAARQELATASEALVEQTDVARATWARIYARFDLAGRLAPESGEDAATEPLRALGPRVEALREQALRLLRRSPRRPRPEIRGAIRAESLDRPRTAVPADDVPAAENR